MTTPAAAPLKVIHGDSGLVAENLTHRIRKRLVINNVSLRLARGEAVALLGPNGAGKTTTFHLLAGLRPADAGTIRLDGHTITHWPLYRRARHGIGYLAQQPSVFRNMSVEGNIRAALETVEPVVTLREQTVDELLTDFSLLHLRKASALVLSGGERRRVEIARALACRPSYLLLDEPLAGIDPIFVGEMRTLIMHIRDRGIGVLITDHNVREALDIVDRAYVLHDGRVLCHGPPHDIVANEDVRRVYLGDRFRM